jgi:hypothetical protein
MNHNPQPFDSPESYRDMENLLSSWGWGVIYGKGNDERKQTKLL